MKDIVFISSIRWDYAWHRQQEFMTKLSTLGYKILFVEPNGKEETENSIKKVLPNVWTLTPRGLPYERCLYSVNIINGFLSRRIIDDGIRQLKMYSPIIMFDRVHGIDIKYYCKKYKTIYDLVDEIIAFGRYKNKKLLISIENYVLRNTDLVTSSSLTLMNRKIKQSNRTGVSCFIPNGVDVARFTNSVEWNMIRNNIKKPVIGFVGTISQRSLDYKLITGLAECNRRWQFVFVGPGKEQDKNNLSGENIHVIDQVPGEMIPSVINSFDVAIIPYITQGELMDYVFPRKACEYLAAGKPVVSTPMKELCNMEPYVQVAHDQKEFSSLIEKALLAGGDEDRRKEFARQYDWNCILQNFLSIISEW